MVDCLVENQFCWVLSMTYDVGLIDLETAVPTNLLFPAAPLSERRKAAAVMEERTMVRILSLTMSLEHKGCREFFL
jgi:hypothetical protein